jgi:hypothetical protein
MKVLYFVGVSYTMLIQYLVVSVFLLFHPLVIKEANLYSRFEVLLTLTMKNTI